MDRASRLALASLACNIAFASYHLVLGAVTSSWWLLTLGAYYLVLSIVRFMVLRSRSNERFITRSTGWMLVILSIPLVGTVILSVIRDRGHELPVIVMIAMAAYAFTKVTLATIRLIKGRRSKVATLIALRSISIADAFVSIFALQRSMLVSFEGMSEAEIAIMNAVFGSIVCVTVALLGVDLLRSGRASSKTLDH